MEDIELSRIEWAKKVQIIPTPSRVSSNGQVKIDFTPPAALVQDGWSQIWDEDYWESASELERLQLEKNRDLALQVEFESKGYEELSDLIKRSLVSFTSGELVINLSFSDPILVSQGFEDDVV